MKKDKNNGVIDGTLKCKEEEKKLKNDLNEVKVTELPIFPNLSE